MALVVVKIAAAIPGLPKVTAEQVLRLNEHKVFSNRDARDDFGYAPTPIEEVLVSEIEQYRSNGSR